MKIIINTAWGGFQLSKEFYDYYGIPCEKGFGASYCALEKWTEDVRKDPRVIEYIENFGSRAASGIYSYLEVVEIPKGTKYYIEEYDSAESIVTEDDIEWEIAD